MASWRIDGQREKIESGKEDILNQDFILLSST